MARRSSSRRYASLTCSARSLSAGEAVAGTTAGPGAAGGPWASGAPGPEGHGAAGAEDGGGAAEDVALDWALLRASAEDVAPEASAELAAVRRGCRTRTSVMLQNEGA